ncbi:hypothetical protein Tco_0960836 [Tanacetum coccineum]
MSTPTFADTYNMVAFLEKPAESDRFHEIIDFLNANQIRYALTIQALIDKKKLIITETSISLHLEDAGGTNCLPTATIFEELARMGYEKPSQKLTFYKAFFSQQWKFFIHAITQCLSAKSTAWNEFNNGGVKFLMYPRFLQVIINQQLGDMSHHKKIYVNPSHTKKIFANMKREGNYFSGRITSLFETMMVQPTQAVGVDLGIPTDSNQTPITTQPSSSRSQKKQSRRKQRKDTKVTQEETQQDDSVPTPSNDPPLSGVDSMQLFELMILCTNLQNQVLDLEKAKDAQAKEIADLKKMVQSLGVHEMYPNKEEYEFIDKDADTLIQIKAAKPKVVTTAATTTTTTTTRPKARGFVVQEPSKFRTPHESQPLMIKDKGKEIMIEPEVPLKRKDEVALDEDLARNLQAQLEAELIKEEKLARKQEEEANIALINSKEKARGNRKKMLGKKREKKEQQQESSKRQRIEDVKETNEHEEV